MRPALVLSAVLLAACAGPAHRPTPRLARVPAVELVTLAGQPARLDEAVGGRVAVVSLWATWCSSCREELAALVRLQARLRAQGGAVVGVAVGEPRAAVQQFLRGHDAPAVQLVDERFGLADALGQDRVPATLVVDRRGVVVFSGGALDADALAALRGALSAR